MADHLQSLWTPSGGSSTFTTPSPPDHGMGTPGSPNLHSLFSSSPLLAASIPGVAAAAAAAHLQSLPPPPPPGPSSQGGQRLSSPGSTEQDIYGGQAGSYPPFGSFHQVRKIKYFKRSHFHLKLANSKKYLACRNLQKQCKNGKKNIIS